MSKSYVTLEQHVCKVCGKAFDTGAILMDRRMTERFEHHTVTDYGLCPEDQAKFNDGYLALVAVSNIGPGNTLKPREAKPTGTIVHIRRTVAREIFNIPIADDLVMCYVQPEVVTKLEEMMPPCPQGS